MITEYYWQNTDIRKKILFTPWQFVFSPPHPHQPWHPWTISTYSVFPQSHDFLDLWSFWLPPLRTNWSWSATCQVGQTIPAEQREAWGICTPPLQAAQLQGCLFWLTAQLLPEEQLRMGSRSLHSCLQNPPSALLLQPWLLPVLLVLTKLSSHFFGLFL